jgi:hypothetical protein
MRRLQLPSLALLPVFLAACGSSATDRASSERPALRTATALERAQIASTVNATWKYESEPPPSVRLFYHARLRRPRGRPRVLSVRVSVRDPRFASAVVETGRSPAVVVLEKDKDSDFGRWGYVVAGPALSFPPSCTGATPRALRDLLCPDPWRLLGYPRPRARAQTRLSQRIPSPDLRRVAWRRVVLPGGACGSTRPIRPHAYRYGPAALIHTDVDLSWWNPVVVYSWSKPVFGDLDGDGRDEAALGVDCANGGGTAGGQLRFAWVVYRATDRSLRVVGILPTRQPLDPETPHVPLNTVTRIERGKVVVSEAWYGPFDGDCCASGVAKTVWTYAGGKLRPTRTTIVRPPWTSPLRIFGVVAEPGEQEVHPFERTRVHTSQGFRFVVTINNVGSVTKRNVKVTLRIRQSPSPIVETRTIARITPWQRPATLFFGHLGRVELGKRTTLTIEIGDRGTSPERYAVLFTGTRVEY